MKDNLRLYFFRHAEAEPGNETLPDHARPLTPRGIARTQRAARVLKAMEVQPNHLYSSPLARARQTADILADTFGITVEARPEVGPGFNVQAVEALIKELDSDESAMFVGHEPDFSATISALIGGGWIEVKKGGLARIDLDSYLPPRGSLVWLIAPKVFDEH